MGAVPAAILPVLSACHFAGPPGPEEMPGDTAPVEEVGSACDDAPRIVLNEVMAASYAGITD